MIGSVILRSTIAYVANKGVAPLATMAIAKVSKGFVLSKGQQVCVTIATVGVCGVVSDKIADYYIQMGEDLKESFNELKGAIKNVSKAKTE